jgi:hypothetical protein
MWWHKEIIDELPEKWRWNTSEQYVLPQLLELEALEQRRSFTLW